MWLVILNALLYRQTTEVGNPPCYLKTWSIRVCQGLLNSKWKDGHRGKGFWNIKEQVNLYSTIDFKSTKGIFRTGRKHEKVIVKHAYNLHCQWLSVENMVSAFKKQMPHQGYFIDVCSFARGLLFLWVPKTVRNPTSVNSVV